MYLSECKLNTDNVKKNVGKTQRNDEKGTDARGWASGRRHIKKQKDATHLLDGTSLKTSNSPRYMLSHDGGYLHN